MAGLSGSQVVSRGYRFLCKSSRHGYYACLIVSRDWHAEVVKPP